MLSISKPMSGAGQGNYYLGLAREDYYVAGGEPPGKWEGKGAELFGLTGKVEPETLRSLLGGYSPDGVRPLAQNAGKPDRQSGWDLTFSSPKSVSVLWALSDRNIREQIQAAQQHSVAVALGYLEEVGGLTRRGKGGGKLERTPLIFATFEHSTSRALDPALHTHALLLNIAQRRDGTTGSLYSKEIFRHKMAAGELYRAELASELTRTLGLQIEPQKSGFHIGGVPESLCREFSKRRRDIETRLQETGHSGAIASKIAALDTRKAKISVPRQELFKDWAETGETHGWGREEAKNLCRSDNKKQPGKAKAEALIRSELSRHASSSARKDPRTTIAQTAKFAQAHGISARDVLSVHRKLGGLLRLSVQQHRIFPNAPSWSPFKNLSVPYLALNHKPSRPTKSQRWGKVLLEKKTPLGTIQVREKALFPKAPKWSPVHGIKAPAIKLKREQEIHR